MSKFLRPNKSKLRNPQHYEFVGAFLTTTADSGLTQSRLTSLLAQLQTAYGKEDHWYMIARASETIAQREVADRQRDAFYTRLHRLVQVWAGSGEPTKDAAAKLLKKDFDLYKVNTTAQLEVESGQMSNLITELLRNDRQAAITTLGGGYLFEQMKTAHETVKTLRLNQGVEESEKVRGALVAARKECDELYDQATYLIEALALAAEEPAPYAAFIKKWNGTLKIYQDILDRKQGNTGNTDKTDKTETPGTTNNPETPETPDNPDNPDNPETPENPDNPDNPENPGTTPDPNPDDGDGME